MFTNSLKMTMRRKLAGRIPDPVAAVPLGHDSEGITELKWEELSKPRVADDDRS